MNPVTSFVRRRSSTNQHVSGAWPFVTLALVLMLLAACAPVQRPAAAPAASPITLHIAIPEPQGRSITPFAFEFVDQVKTLSNGSLIVEPIWDVGAGTPGGNEPGLIQTVIEGKPELGVVPSRSWDGQHITSLHVLQAPFLITDDALAQAVATSEVGTRLLNSLSPVGVVGLTMWPADLRHPFSEMPDKPLLAPQDFAGQVIRAGTADITQQLIKLLGATRTSGDDGYQGAESGFLNGYTLNGKPTATGNVTFYPRFDILFANAAAFAGLSDEQRTVVRQAAAAAQRKAIAEHPKEADTAAAWCADGGTVVLASPEQLAAFEQAAQPIFDQIAQDPANAELIAMIRELKANTTPSPGAAACAPTETAEPASAPTASAPVTSTTGANLPRIVFSSFRDGNTELYLMNADGTSQTRLTDNSFWDDQPAASRDGKRIAFASDRDGNDEIYTMNIDGSSVLRLTNNQAKDGLPAFSPDGTQIVFFSERDGNVEIYRMNVDGSDQVNLTNNPALDHYPSWSPDGKQIIFNSTRDGHASSNEVLDPNGEVYVMRPDGSDQTRLTHDEGNDGRPLWSPDGKQIIVDTDRGQPAEIYAMNPDGSGQTRLTHNVGQIGSIAWSLDGKQISFTSGVTGDDEIYVMNADGSNITQLTNSPGQDTWSAWLPASGTTSAAFDGLSSGLDNAKLARIRATSALPDGPNVDVYVNGQPARNGGKLQQGIPSSEFSGWLYVPPGDYSVALVPHGGTIEAALFAPATVTAEAGHRYTVAAMGEMKDNSVKPLVVDETALEAGIGDKPTSDVYISIDNLKGIGGVDTRHDGKLIGEANYGGAAAMVCPNDERQLEEITVAGKPDKVIASADMWCHLGVSSAAVWYGDYPDNVIGGSDSQGTSETTNVLDFLGVFNSHALTDDNGQLLTFNTLLSAVDKAGMREQFASTDPYYFLAPTDAAFAQLPKDQLDALLNDPQALTKLLKAHFVPGYYPAGSLSGSMYGQAKAEVTNLLGQKLQLLGSSINGLQVAGHSFTVGNGNRVQLIDKVLPVQ